MAESSAAEALRDICERAFKGARMSSKEWFSLVDDVSSAAYVDLLRIAPALADLPPAQTYIIEGEEAVGEDRHFRVRFPNGVRDVEAIIVMTKINGAWRIGRFKLPGVYE